MKKIIVVFLMIAISFLAATPAKATREQATANALRIFQIQSYFGYKHKGVSSNFMYGNEYFISKVPLVAGFKYVFVAAGCDDAYDVDIAIGDFKGDTIAYDDDFDTTAVVSFIAPYSGDYLVKVTLADGKYDGAHVFLMIGFK